MAKQRGLYHRGIYESTREIGLGLSIRLVDDTSPEVELLRARCRARIENGILTRTTNSYPFLLTLPEPYCEPFRKMIALPEIVSRLNVMCGKGFRMDHGPQFIGGIDKKTKGEE